VPPIGKKADNAWGRFRLLGFAPNSNVRFFLFKLVLVTGFCAGLLLSPALWIGPRSFPLVPVSWAPVAIGSSAAVVLYCALFVLAIAALIARRPRWCAVAFVAIMMSFCVADQTRWQPWVFQYTVLMAALAFGPSGDDDQTSQERVLDLGRLVIAFTYIFAGLQKINSNFMFVDFPWLVQPVTSLIPPVARFLPWIGMTAPFVQVGFGVGLLTRRWRAVSLAVAVAMHVLILTVFGPIGHGWNDVVWPWTAAMAGFDIVLFSGTPNFTWRDIFASRGDPVMLATFVLFAILPFLSFFNLWDSFLSAAIYSGNLTEGEIYISDAGLAAISPAIRARLVHTSPNTNVLNIQRWTIEDLNVLPYPETRAYQAVTRSICRDLTGDGQLVLIIREQRLFRSRPETGFRCSQL
jgi:hypothetical protein